MHMKEHPDYKYRPRRKPKTLRKEGYPYSIPYPSVPMDALRAGKSCILASSFVQFAINSMRMDGLDTHVYRKRVRVLYRFLLHAHISHVNYKCWLMDEWRTRESRHHCRSLMCLDKFRYNETKRTKLRKMTWRRHTRQVAQSSGIANETSITNMIFVNFSSL